MATQPSILAWGIPWTEGLAAYSPWDGRVRYDLATKQHLGCMLSCSLCSHGIKRCFLLGRKAMTNLDSILKSRNITLPTKVHLVKAMVFSSSQVWMWELDHKESWILKNWCFLSVVLKTLENPLDWKEIKPVNPKGNQSLIFIGKTDTKAEIPILQVPDAKNWLLEKDPDARKDWSQEEKGMTENEMVKWHHRLNGHEFEQVLGVGDGQGNLACCSPWG